MNITNVKEWLNCTTCYFYIVCDRKELHKPGMFTMLRFDFVMLFRRLKKYFSF